MWILQCGAPTRGRAHRRGQDQKHSNRLFFNTKLLPQLPPASPSYTASQALSFGNGKTAPFLESIVGLFRQKIPIVKEDRVMHYDIVKASEFITSLEIDVKELF